MSVSKIVAAAASGVGGAGLDVDEVFSCHLYEGTSANRSIVNGIDLSGEGGLVWTKVRTQTDSHYLFDTERGVNKRLSSNATGGQQDETAALTAFNSNGFSLGNATAFNGNAANWGSAGNYVSWTFRKAPNFFDIVTYSGNDSNRTISHNLGSVPGMIIIKRLNNNNPWIIYHRSTGNTGFQSFDFNGFATVSNAFNNTSPTSSNFALGSRDDVNQSGGNYIAYLFAHNDGDGGFGPSGDQDIIKCGSYSSATEINLGFEPQWLIAKRTSSTGNWYMVNNMTGFTNAAYGPRLIADLNLAEGSDSIASVTSTGFNSQLFDGSGTYVYMAIRRGPLAVPEDATKVFSVNETGTGDSPANVWNVGFASDMNINTQTGSNPPYILARLAKDKYLRTSSTAADGDASNSKIFTSSTGTLDLNTSWWGASTSDVISWNWKRAPSYFDVCCYSGTNNAGLTFNHNLGVKPEMIWVKNRDASEYWAVYHKDLNGGTNPSHYFLKLNGTDAETDYNEIWNDTEPTATQVTVGQQGVVNGFEKNHIAYLFATVPGVSKVGSYTGNGSDNHQIDCGFSSGARFVLIKRTDTSEGWKVHDSVRGIVSGDDPFVELNNSNAENSSFDLVDPYSGGFAVNNYVGWNASGGSYIFYAIA